MDRRDSWAMWRRELRDRQREKERENPMELTEFFDDLRKRKEEKPNEEALLRGWERMQDRLRRMWK